MWCWRKEKFSSGDGDECCLGAINRGATDRSAFFQLDLRALPLTARFLMNFEWRYSENGIDWDELSNLYRIAPLGEKKSADLQQVFGNSMFCCFVFHTDTLVGAGRGLADGRDCSYLCDVAVHPQYQGKGLGSAIVAKLVDLSAGHNKIMLYSEPGKEVFYRRLGFKRLTTAMAIFEDPDKALAERLIDHS